MNKGKNENRAQVIFFNKNDSGENVAYEIDIGKDGQYIKPPEDFRKFFINESIQKFQLL